MKQIAEGILKTSAPDAEMIDRTKEIVLNGANEIFQKMDTVIREPGTCENIDLQELENDAS